METWNLLSSIADSGIVVDAAAGSGTLLAVSSTGAGGKGSFVDHAMIYSLRWPARR